MSCFVSNAIWNLWTTPLSIIDTNITESTKQLIQKSTLQLVLKSTDSIECVPVQVPNLAEDNRGCSNLSAIPDASTLFDFSSQRLDISIPQAAMFTTAQDYIPPDKYDDGINAMILNYQLSGSEDYQSDEEYYSLNLQSGSTLAHGVYEIYMEQKQ